MKILVAEDDRFHANYILDAISDALPEVTETVHALNGAEAEAEALGGAYDGIVMDLQMDGRNGIDAARTIWSHRPDSRILFWSNYADQAYLRGIARIVPEASAYGYVLKTASRERLTLALRAVLLEGQIMVNHELHQLQRKGPYDSALDESEYAILLDLALGLQDKAIAKRRNMSLRTVQNRLLSIYDKLGVEDAGGEMLNKRVRALNCAIRSKVLNLQVLESANAEYERWRQRD
ncbi:response regulator transcription factor [Falsirhodobacter algicola]|uniref:Response regulator n=1 Tax=Falsirhodobacter algicola TaxID=2692330 RepID=A0A8J8MTX7_9RHOB|nr:response regulator transcription factor [Falsirhodobacter algicola]QUS36248.1 response regulator [Falsirhodobacter algicola]